MKGEIAQGQITIKELKGKLTMDVVDKILFASGESAVKKEGLEVLDRVVEILKTVKDKNIRIEGHTDNIKIKNPLAKKYPPTGSSLRRAPSMSQNTCSSRALIRQFCQQPLSASINRLPTTPRLKDVQKTGGLQ